MPEPPTFSAESFFTYGEDFDSWRVPYPFVFVLKGWVLNEETHGSFGPSGVAWIMLEVRALPCATLPPERISGALPCATLPPERISGVPHAFPRIARIHFVL